MSDSFHHWSGWPGAYCLHCGADDPWEYALGMNYYDPFTEKWDTEEHEQECLKAAVCPNPGPHVKCGQCMSKKNG